MITFMLGVLVSVVFWACYIPASFVIALFLLKWIGKRYYHGRSYVTLTSGKHASRTHYWGDLLSEYWVGDDPDAANINDIMWVAFTVIVYMAFWPIIVSFGIFVGGVELSCRMIYYIAGITINRIPEVEVSFKKEEKEKGQEPEKETNKIDISKISPANHSETSPTGRFNSDAFFTGYFHGGDFLVNFKQPNSPHENDPWPARIELNKDGKRLNIQWTNGHQAITLPEHVNIFWYIN